MNDVHPKSLSGNTVKLILGLLLLIAASLIMVSCNDFQLNETLPTPGAGKITVELSDPATCQSPNGPYSHVYVTIADVRANTSESAGDGDSGWVDLTPSLSKAPMQVDLLGKADNQCHLATLGENLDVPPGVYKQFRVVLAANNAALTTNACGNSTSCIVLASDSSVHPLEISDEATTGITIGSDFNEYLGPGNVPPGLTVVAKQIRTLDINFLACESIVQDGQGSYRLKPVLTAGEAKFSPNSLHGKILDGETGQAVKGVVFVALERPDDIFVYAVVRSTLADADGSFNFCPVPAGTYSLVVVGTREDGAFYEPSVIYAIHADQVSEIGDVKLYPLSPTENSFVTLAGKVASQTSSPAGTVADMTVSAIENGPNHAIFTIPMSPTSTQSSATLNVTTVAPHSNLTCLADTYCANYSIQVPAGSLNFADFKDRTHLTPNATLPTYQIYVRNYIPSSGGVASCTPSQSRTQPFTPSAAGVTVAVPTLRFKQCQ
jgi:Domain of unknown function (DUF4382)